MVVDNGCSLQSTIGIYGYKLIVHIFPNMSQICIYAILNLDIGIQMCVEEILTTFNPQEQCTLDTYDRSDHHQTTNNSIGTQKENIWPLSCQCLFLPFR